MRDSWPGAPSRGPSSLTGARGPRKPKVLPLSSRSSDALPKGHCQLHSGITVDHRGLVSPKLVITAADHAVY
jgi:hypothetical protein